MSMFSQSPSMRDNLLPGALVHVGEQKMETPRIRMFDYTKDRLDEKEFSQISEAFPYFNQESVTWVNVDGLHDVELFRQIQKFLKIHPLVLEDILNTKTRPKFECHDDYLFVVVKSIGVDPEATKVDIEQISFVLGRNFVLSFQERPGDFFESVRERLRASRGRIRSQGADYLVYALIDAIVDHYFIIPERLSDRIETIETRVLSNSSPGDLQEIYALKQEIVLLDRSIWPLIEMIGGIRKEETNLFSESLSPFLRDLSDHVEQLVSAFHALRDMASNLQDLYLSSVSNSMNEVMKVLAIIATIFIPLTFLAGIFGMNFEFMPELKFKYAYHITLLVMVVIAVVMTYYFRKKRWL